MIFKKKFLLLIISLIIILQTVLYINNKQRSSFRYFKWTVQEVSIGKLISISFFSGLFVSTLLNITLISFKKNNYENREEIFESTNNDDNLKSNIDMPPQRDIRDSQPTISVNYRVVKNIEKNDLQRDQDYSNFSEKDDDWKNDQNDW